MLAFVAALGCDRKSENSPLTSGEPSEVKKKAKEITENVTSNGPEPIEANICLAAQNRRIPIIMFHDMMVERTKQSLWYDCSVEEFEDILEAIDLEGYTVISLDLLYDHLTKGVEVPEKSIVLTFDDNYQSFYDLAWPILKRYEYPVAMFVHTGFVGKKEGRPKMSWDTLKELVKDELFTVGAHTVNHFLDLKDRDSSTQTDELANSKSDLERELGIEIPYLAYPNGSNSEETQLLARTAGFKMAFTIENFPAEESPNIMAVGRYVHTKWAQLMKDREESVQGAPSEIARYQWDTESPVRYVKGDFAGIPLRLTIGGLPKSVMSDSGREPVKAFVEREGAVAGINGGFFAMAAVQSTDNRMVGPLKTGEMDALVPDEATERWPKILNRPLVIWSDKEFAILPFIPAQMRSDEQFAYFMENYTDTFMAGTWLVRNGAPRLADFQNIFGAKDIQDYRRRAFIGITKEGQFIAGCAVTSVSSERLAFAAAEAGAQEAVLIDSGFSTSLVFDGKVKASGHSSPSDPSRPVPHAIVINGTIDPASNDDEDLKSVDAYPEQKKKRRSRR